MLKKIKVRIDGLVPLLMHNGRMADPINCEFAAKLKDATGEKIKNPETMKRLEWFGSLYTMNGGDTVAIPGENIERMISKAAPSKKGKLWTAFISCDGDKFPLDYDGPKEIALLFDDERFVDQRLVVVNRGRILRTRPRFDTWGLDFTIVYDGDQIQAPKTGDHPIKLALQRAGREQGLMDGRPKYGRFEVSKFQEL